MERQKGKLSGKKILAVAAAAVLLAAVGFGIEYLVDRGENTPQTTEDASGGQSPADDAGTSDAGTTAQASESDTTESETERDLSEDPMTMIGAEKERLNRFLTSIVQQEIENTATDLDDDAELVRFAFRYRETNDPESILKTEDGDGPARSLTLTEVNETLDALFGRTLSPDREDYSVMLEEGEVFRCVYRDGRFLNTPPYPAEEFPFRIRFALVESVDEETCTLRFRLYQVNPNEWGIGEALYHLPLLPLLHLREAENLKGEQKRWITRIGTGVAVLRDLGTDLQLLEMTTTLLN